MMAHMFKIKCGKNNCVNYVEQFYGCDTCHGFNYYRKGGVNHQEIKTTKSKFHNCVNAKKDSIKKSVVVRFEPSAATLFNL